MPAASIEIPSGHTLRAKAELAEETRVDGALAAPFRPICDWPKPRPYDQWRIPRAHVDRRAAR